MSAGGALARAPVALCAHCGLPAGAGGVPGEAVYCCGGCALAHRLTGGPGGHGEAAGLLMAVGVGAFLAMNVMMLSFVLYTGRGEADRPLGEAWVRWALLALATPALVLLGAPFITRGLRRARRLRLDTDVLIVLGVAAAFAISVRSVLAGGGPLYLDTAMGILLFVTVGRYLEAAARARTTDALTALLQQMPAEACRLRDGVEERVPVEQLRPGDRLRVRPGERLPVDGVIEEGEASVAEGEVTGEPLPVSRAPGEGVAAGTTNLDGSLVVRAVRTGADTTLARIVRLVEEARAEGYPLAPLVDRVSAAFVPLVLLVAAGTFAWWLRAAGPGEAVLNSLCVLLIACPCAIGIATPLASTAAVGRAAAAGVLVRNGEAFERLARARRVFLDKTGTLTRGLPAVAALEPAPDVDETRLLSVAAALEAHSEHPIAAAVRRAAAERGLAVPAATSFRAVPGRGVTAALQENGHLLEARVGSAAFAGQPGDEGAVTAVHVTLGGAPLGRIVLRDDVRTSACDAVARMQARGLAVEVLSGDQPAAVAAFARGLPGVSAHGGLTPEQKLAHISAAVAAGAHPVMVGDGINDAPALSRAAVGVALESGTDLARDAAEVTILGGDLRRLPWVLGLAAATLRVARLNLAWAFSYNLVGMGLAVAGLLHPFFGAAAMVASSLLVVTHSRRLARYPLPEAGS